MASDPPQDDLSGAFPRDDRDLIIEDALPSVDGLKMPVVPVDDLMVPEEVEAVPLPAEALLGPPPAAAPPPIAAPPPVAAASAPARPAPRVSSVRAPRPVVSVAPRRGRSMPTKLLLAAGIGGVVVAAAFVVRAVTEEAPPVSQVVLPKAPVTPAAPVAAAPAATAKTAESLKAPKPPSDAETRRVLQGMVFGGRPMTWWEERLDGLHDASLTAQPEVYGATLERVQRLGFDLKEGPPAHVLRPGQTLIKQINSRRAP